MQVRLQHTQKLFDKIRGLPPEKVAVVEEFVEFLKCRGDAEDAILVRAADRLSEKSFQQVWDNAEDADYDSL